MSDASHEHEIKLAVEDLEPLRARLREIGAQCIRSEELETNTIFDWQDAVSTTLRASGRLLRLRQDGRGTRLTFKGRARFEAGVKVREERELSIEDAATAQALLEGIGLEPVQRYQKYRETWHLERTEVVLDRTPLGCFVEIELRAGGSVLDAARALGLGPERAETRSYLELWAEHRRRRPEAPRDMVFPRVHPPPGPSANED